MPDVAAVAKNRCDQKRATPCMDQHTIKGQAGYDANSFFDKVKESVIHLFISNPSTKVMMIFHCVMERINKETDQLEFTLPYFRTAPEII